jgi:hypothetical protein
MQRESMIDLLVLDSFEKMADSSRGIWLLSVLREGFVGFAGMSDAQLANAMLRRGLCGDAASTEIEEWELPDTDPDLQLALAATGVRSDAWD